MSSHVGATDWCTIIIAVLAFPWALALGLMIGLGARQLIDLMDKR